MSMTPVVAIPDQVASPDQGDALATQVPESSSSPQGHSSGRPVRLRMSSAIGRGALDGAWWPYSRDLAAEAVDLVDHSPLSLDEIFRVVYSTPDWEPPSRRVKAAKVFLSLGSFPRDDTHQVLLMSMSSSRVLRLLVVPPEWGEQTAEHAMRIAATSSNVKSASAILIESVDVLLAGLLSHWDDDGGLHAQT